MEKPVIQFMFSCGFRCYSPDALKSAGLRMMSGPFDYIFIDLESAFKLITRKFDGFIDDIIEYKKAKGTLSPCYFKYTKEIDSRFLEFVKGPVLYMAKNQMNEHFFYNQMYLDDELDYNLYNWKKICVFAHSNLFSTQHRETINRRCERFNKITEEFSSSTILFHITKIITDVDKCVRDILDLKLAYSSVQAYLVAIICYDESKGIPHREPLFTDNVLFIFKPVESYEVQFTKYREENERYDYSKEIDIMREYFIIDLLSLDDIQLLLN
jgi:Putative papain-like cysteine peptidase (DUF1796)